MKKLVLLGLVLILAGVSQATIVYTNACDDFEDGQWENCDTFAFSNVPSSVSGDGALKAVSTTGQASFVWNFSGASNWMANAPVTTADKLELDLRAGQDFRIDAYIDGVYRTLMDWTWLSSSWQHYSFNMPVAGNLQFVMFGYWGSGMTAYVDNISVTSVPEPATMAIMGLASIFALRRKK